MINLEWPWLLLLLPLPYLIFRLCPAAKPQSSAIRIPHYQQWASLGGHHHDAPGRTNRLRAALFSIAWGLLVIACARPIWQGEPIELPSKGREIMLAVDLSGSMAETDLQLNGQAATRLSVVKAVLNDFIKRRKGDKIGLVLFGSQAYLQAPLTFDRATVATLLNESQLGFAGKQTAIGDAIGLSIKRLQHRPAESRVVILLTDGANNAGEVEPIAAAERAKKAGLTIYTVGVGSSEMTQSSPFGGLFGSRTVNPSADLDRSEATLQKVAELTGGQYFRARSAADLEAIYAQLDKLQPIEQQSLSYRPQKSLFFWPLGAALSILLMLSLSQLFSGGRRG
ncbi:Ca-activated chloride channel family protein [Sinobacterium caligoides]|uniref:Ca-activated chloride channel family protein n=1 Tax=Sinobacterium caligoides TaxID=933926 RepID=A0A3N2DYX6_9GAMM|nr:VWA domain-containing protein [Sinobacterium caligoides]ROS05004.1 Ca-activated chloride channel family protein [Sinobacterium caligoides]